MRRPSSASTSEAEPLVGEHALERDDRARAAPRSAGPRPGQAGRQPVAVRPRDRGRRLEAARRPAQSFSGHALRPSFIRSRNWWSRAASTSGTPSIVSDGRATRIASPSASRASSSLAGRLGRLGQPVVVRGLVGGRRDLVAVALDQPAVLAEDDQGVGLGDDQVAVADGEVAAGGLELLLELDRGLGAQAGGLVEDVDLGPGRPVDLVAGQQAAAEPLEAGRCRARCGAACRS